MKKTVEELEARLLELIDKPPYAAKELAELLAEAPASKSRDWVNLVLQAYDKAACDFEGAYSFMSASWELIEKTLQTAAAQMVQFTVPPVKSCCLNAELLAAAKQVRQKSRADIIFLQNM